MFLDKYIFNPANLTEGFTQSEISTLSNCGMLWYYRYNLGLKAKGSFSWALVVGDAVHDAIEQLLASRGEFFTLKEFRYPEGVLLTPTEREKEYYWKCVTQAMMEAYQLYWKKAGDFEYDYNTLEDIEMEIDTEFQGFRLRGKLDWKMKPGAHESTFIVDHKTCSRLDKSMAEEWDFRFQFMFYPWAARRMGFEINGFMPNAIKKPELRQKMGESVEGFAARVKADMIIDPEKYFYRERQVLTKDSMEHFERRVLRPKIARLQLLANPDPALQQVQQAIAWDMNTDYCQKYGRPCEFIRLCRHGWDKFGFEFEQRPAKHEELSGDPGE